MFSVNNPHIPKFLFVDSSGELLYSYTSYNYPYIAY